MDGRHACARPPFVCAPVPVTNPPHTDPPIPAPAALPPADPPIVVQALVHGCAEGLLPVHRLPAALPGPGARRRAHGALHAQRESCFFVTFFALHASRALGPALCAVDKPRAGARSCPMQAARTEPALHAKCAPSARPPPAPVPAQVPILNEGDVCNELYLVVDGEVATSAPVDRSKRRGSVVMSDTGPALDPDFLAEGQQVRGRAHAVRVCVACLCACVCVRVCVRSPACMWVAACVCECAWRRWGARGGPVPPAILHARTHMRMRMHTHAHVRSHTYTHSTSIHAVLRQRLRRGQALHLPPVCCTCMRPPPIGLQRGPGP